jgi:Cytochrome c7 and related cytochrome c/Class III cytochrome C family
MAQTFHPSTNTISRVSIYGSLVVLIVLSFALYWVGESPYYTEVKVPVDQPVPFSHRHHAGELGIDCRYCHTSVEESSFAGIPPTKTCMTCHSQIWTNSEMLEPVRASYATGKSLVWNRVNALPDFVYFNHSIHIHKGIGCTTCHGPIADMPLTWKANTLLMGWCVGCHREPEKYIRPREEVFNARYEPPSNFHPVSVRGRKYFDQISMGRDLMRTYKVQKLTTCYTCHR